MKFLSFCTMKDTLSSIPPAMSRQLLEASLEWTNKQMKAGKILETYAIPGNQGTVAICEHSTAEDLYQTISTIPTFGFMDFKIYPLADFNQSMKATIESIKAIEKMVPSQMKEMAGVR